MKGRPNTFVCRLRMNSYLTSTVNISDASFYTRMKKPQTNKNNPQNQTNKTQTLFLLVMHFGVLCFVFNLEGVSIIFWG